MYILHCIKKPDNIEECDCACHEARKHISHIARCCFECPECQKRIKTSFWIFHQKKHKAKQDEIEIQ